MPSHEALTEFPFRIEPIFGLLCQPVQRVALAPPEMKLSLIEAPPVLAVGARLVMLSRRMGLSVRLISEIAELEPNARIVEVQHEGPFAFCSLTQRLAVGPSGRTALIERIEYELPGGLLGLFLRSRMVEREWRAGLVHRDRRLVDLLTGLAGSGG